MNCVFYKVGVYLRLNYNIFVENAWSFPRNIRTNIDKGIGISKSDKLGLLVKQRITFVSNVNVIAETVCQKLLL
jgi:hypothetical protein